jgi:hypothetical protein
VLGTVVEIPLDAVAFVVGGGDDTGAGGTDVFQLRGVQTFVLQRQASGCHHGVDQWAWSVSAGSWTSAASCSPWRSTRVTARSLAVGTSTGRTSAST